MNVVIVPSLGAFGAGEHFLSAKRRQDFGAYFHNKEVGGKIKKEKRKKKEKKKKAQQTQRCAAPLIVCSLNEGGGLGGTTSTHGPLLKAEKHLWFRKAPKDAAAAPLPQLGTEGRGEGGGLLPSSSHLSRGSGRSKGEKTRRK